MRRSQLITIMATVSVGLVVGSGAYWQHRLAPLKTLRIQQTNTPTIFVAGDYARAFSTNGFVHRLSATHLMTKALVINVAKNGHVAVQQLAPLRHNPTIQVVFKDNHHPQRQARQLVTVMQVLHDRYHVTDYNAVGHSSGGNIIFDYLIDRPQHQPRIHKFVTIASTYPHVTAQQLAKLPKHLAILNLAGQIWQTKGDGEVNLKAVLAFSTTLTQHGFQPVTKIILGSPLTAQHSMLHINPQVDYLLVKFLYGYNPS